MHKRLIKSVGYAKAGIHHALLTQPNMWFHVTAAAVASLLAWWLDFSLLEWCILILVIGIVIILELVNTVAELIVDLASPEFSELARIAKDVSAGAVLIAAITSLLVGSLLFLSKLF